MNRETAEKHCMKRENAGRIYTPPAFAKSYQSHPNEMGNEDC
jgi:hypothetical protein